MRYSFFYCFFERGFIRPILTHQSLSAVVDMQSYELCSDMIDVVIDISCIYGSGEGAISAYDAQSSSIIRLNNGLVRC